MFKFNRKEKGQGLVEYALILVLIAIVVIVAMRVLGNKVSDTFGTVNTELAGGADGGGGGADIPSEAQDFGVNDADASTDKNVATTNYCGRNPGTEYNLYINSSSGSYTLAGFVTTAYGDFAGTGTCP